LLEKQGQGARRLELLFFRADGATRRIGIETARPLREPKTILRLFRDKLEALADPLDPGFGFDVIRLTAPLVEQETTHEPDFDGRNDLAADLAALIEQLGVKLTPYRITRLLPQDTHMPERATLSIAAQNGNAALKADWDIWQNSDAATARPIRLLDPPEPIEVISEVPDGPPIRLRWRRVFHVVVQAEGPERIAPEWWRAAGQALPMTRDYYRVENEHGLRFWIFRAGLYGRETDAPRWFMHGLFG
jgi:protein ImuB